MRIAAAACVVVCLGMALPAGILRAQDGVYPNKPVRLVVPFAPGASTDTLARLIGQKLAESLGQQFITDNRPGAGGAIGAETVARAAPDGYTLMLANPGPLLNNALLRRKPPYAYTDFAAIVYIGSTPTILVANPKFPPNDVKELVAYAKTNPGKATWGSSGVSSNPHVALELLKKATGVHITHVPYKGSAPALTDTVGGQIDGLYTTTVTAEAMIRSGRAKVLGIAGPRRIALLPNVATLVEQGITGADILLWIGLVTTAKVPRPIIEKLNAEMNRTLQMPDVKQRFDQLGMDVEGGTPARFEKFIRAQAEALQGLIKAGVLPME
ncbi:MAG TPA: tripartite tricarboxylate transporter substrate binding protein, partial [Ramlibacter sp.]|nr:tripartite tricarboxylate transporter substrate binding protein [Ramlibacter sp.]